MYNCNILEPVKSGDTVTMLKRSRYVSTSSMMNSLEEMVTLIYNRIVILCSFNMKIELTLT